MQDGKNIVIHGGLSESSTYVRKEHFDRIVAERDALHAQLAERDAALDALTEIATGYKCDLDEAHALLKTHTDHVAQLCDVMFRHGLGTDKEAKTKIYAALAQQQIVFALLSASAERNQCDGCQAGIPLVKGSHHMGKPDGYADTMSCQAGKYASAEPSALVERDDPCEWTDRQMLDFLGVALKGEVRLSEIRQGFEYMRDRAALERKP